MGDIDVAASPSIPGRRRTSSVPACPQDRRYVSKALFFMTTYDVDPQDRHFRINASLPGRNEGASPVPALPAEQQQPPLQQPAVDVAEREAEHKRKDQPKASRANVLRTLVRPREQRNWRYSAVGRGRQNPRISKRQEELDPRSQCEGFWSLPKPSADAQQLSLEPAAWPSSPVPSRPPSQQGQAPSRPETPCEVGCEVVREVVKHYVHESTHPLLHEDAMRLGSMCKPGWRQKHMASKSGRARPSSRR